MRLFQPHRNTGLVCLALMAGLPLFVQLAADPFPTSIRVKTRAMTSTPQQAAADSVTLQELSHSVPSRARREMEKGRQTNGPKQVHECFLIDVLGKGPDEPFLLPVRFQRSHLQLNFLGHIVGVGRIWNQPIDASANTVHVPIHDDVCS